VLAWRTGTTDGSKSKRYSQRPAHGNDRCPIRGCGMHFAATAGGKWSVCNGAVAGWFNPRHIDGAAACSVEQSGDLRAQRHTIVDYCDAGEGNGDLAVQ
jgi:hypothetical protein